MDRVYLQEAFHAMELLEEEDFRLDDVGVKDILDFKDHDELDDIVDVFDPEADTEEEVKDSYIGSVILECEVCHSPIFKSIDEVVVDEDSDLANIDDECPICHSQDGFKVIGQVAPFQEEPELKVEVEDKFKDEEPDEEDSEVQDDEEVEESLKEGCGKALKEDDDEIFDDEVEGNEVVVEEDAVVEKVEELEGKIEELEDKLNEVADAAGVEVEDEEETEDDDEEEVVEESLREGFERIDLETEDKVIHVSEEEKEPVPGEEMITPVSDELEAELTAPEEEPTPAPVTEPMMDEMPVEDDFAAEESELDEPIEDEPAFEESLQNKKTPSVDEAWIVRSNVDGDICKCAKETEGIGSAKETVQFFQREDKKDPERKGKVVYEIVNDGKGDEEEYDWTGAAKKDQSTEDNYTNNKDEDTMIDYDIDDFSEDEFDELGEAYLKNVYENVSSFKTVGVSQVNESLVVEGVITFASGKEKATKFMFEAKDATKSGKVRFVGENAQISRGKKSFTLSGAVDKGKFIAESLNYNYRVDSNRVYGTVKVNK